MVQDGVDLLVDQLIDQGDLTIERSEPESDESRAASAYVREAIRAQVLGDQDASARDSPEAESPPSASLAAGWPSSPTGPKPSLQSTAEPSPALLRNSGHHAHRRRQLLELEPWAHPCNRHRRRPTSRAPASLRHFASRKRKRARASSLGFGSADT